MKQNIPLSKPNIGRTERKKINEVINSNWLTMGPVTNEFEFQFASKLGIKYALAVSSCTSALHMSCIALDLHPGDEVICPVLTFVATANAIEYTGAKAVFVNPKSINDLTLDPYDIERKISERTKAIMVMHYGGYSADMAAIMKIAEKNNIHIIEDCAHALFAKNYDESYLGTLGLMGCFSFYGNKNMTTGEGGMIVTNNAEYANKLKLIRSHGMTSLSFDRYKGHASSYDVKLLGYNYRIDDLRSAIGIAQLAKVHMFNEKRRNLIEIYRYELASVESIIVPFANFDISNTAGHLMVIITKEDPNGIRDFLAERGIQTSRHYQLINSFDYYQNHDFILADELINNLITLPLYPDLKKKQVRQICSHIRDYFG